MKIVSTLLLAGAVALGSGAAFAQSSNGTTSGNSSMTAPSTPNTGATTTQGDQKQATTPGAAKGKNAKSKSKMTTGSGTTKGTMTKGTMTKGSTGSTSAKPSTQTDPAEKDSTGKDKKAVQ